MGRGTRVLMATGGVALALTVLAGVAWWVLQPRVEPLALPDGLVAVSGPAGTSRLNGAEARADYPALAAHFESQRLVSYCGVASGVAVLNALGRRLDQSTFFDAHEVGPGARLRVMFGGMTLAELAGFLMAHGAAVELRYADAVTVEAFREAVGRNLRAPDDFMLVNYQREVLGQRRVGHISPVAAYDQASDSVLILDTATYNYPATWVPLARLHAAMAETDSASGRARGFVEVSNAR